jgi:predicted dehydrogenase
MISHSQNLNKPTLVAVVGCGYWGKNLVRNFHQLGALGLVCEPTESGALAAQNLSPDVPICESFDDVLRAPVHGVVIASPAETHYDLALRALESGKDVFVEKPLALAAHQGQQLLNLAEANQRILMVGHVLEYHPGIEAIGEMVSTGELGPLRYVYSNRLSFGKIRREENILWSFAPHDVAVILRLMGSMPFQVNACGGSYLQPNIADVTITTLLFDNGVRAHIHVSWLHPFKEQRLVVIGERAMVSFDDVSKRLTLYRHRVEVQNGQSVPVPSEGELVSYPDDEPLRKECQAFLAAIATRRPPVTDGASGLRVLKVLQAAQRSLVTNGEPVALPIETFNGAHSEIRW